MDAEERAGSAQGINSCSWKRDEMSFGRFNGLGFWTAPSSLFTNSLRSFVPADTKIVDLPSLQKISATVLSTTSAQSFSHVSQSLSPAEMTTADISAHFHLISAFDVPRCVYSSQKKTFESTKKGKELLGSAGSKPVLFKERYDLLKQRLLRNDLFRADSSFAVKGNLEDEEGYFKVRRAEERGEKNT
jgi:hypothetical protein